MFQESYLQDMEPDDDWYGTGSSTSTTEEQAGPSAPTLEPESSERQLQINNLVDQLKNINGALDNKNWTGTWGGGGDTAITEAAKVLLDKGVTDLRNLSTVSRTETVPDWDGTYYERTVKDLINSTTGSVITTDETGGNQFVLGHSNRGNFLKNTDRYFGIQFSQDASGNPIPIPYTSNQSGGIGAQLLAIASVIPGPYQPLFMAANAAYQLDQGNIEGAILNALGSAGAFASVTNTAINALASAGDLEAASTLLNTVGGTLAENLGAIQTASKIANALNAIDKENWAGLLNQAGSLWQQQGGDPTSINTGLKLVNFAAAVDSGSGAAILTSLGELTNNADAKIAGAAKSLIDAVRSGEPSSVISSIQSFNNVANNNVNESTIYQALRDGSLGETGIAISNAFSRVEGGEKLSTVIDDIGLEKQARDLYKSQTGRDLPASFFQDNFSDEWVAKADALYTTEDEAKQLYRNATGYEPTESQLLGMIGLSNADASAIADNYANTTTEEAEQFFKDLFGADYKPTSEEILQITGLPEALAKNNVIDSRNTYITNENKALAAAKDYVDGSINNVPEFDKDFYKEEYAAAVAAAKTGDFDRVDQIVNWVNQSYTTRNEAEEILKTAHVVNGVTDYEPSKEEIDALVAKPQQFSKVYADASADRVYNTFKGETFKTPQLAAAAAADAGYTMFSYDGKTFKVPELSTKLVSVQLQIDNVDKFDEAFKLARTNLGPGQAFSWKGKVYTTNLDTEVFDGSKANSNWDAAMQAFANKSANFIGPDGKTYKAPTVEQIISVTANINDYNYSEQEKNAILAEEYKKYLAPVSSESIKEIASKNPSGITIGGMPLGTWQDFINTSKNIVNFPKDAALIVNKGLGEVIGAFGNFQIYREALAEQQKYDALPDSAKQFIERPDYSQVHKDNFLVEIAKAAKNSYDNNISDIYKTQENEVWAGLNELEKQKASTWQKWAYLAENIATRPFGIGAILGSELASEAPSLVVGGAVFKLLGAFAGAGSLFLMNAAEIGGSSFDSTMQEAEKLGYDTDTAVTIALKKASVDMLVEGTLETVGDLFLVKGLSKVFSAGLSPVLLSIPVNAITEGAEGYLGSINGDWQFDRPLDFEKANTSFVVGSFVGTFVGGSISGFQQLRDINEEAIVAEKYNGEPATIADLKNNRSEVNLDSLNLTAAVGTNKDGGTVSLGTLIAAPFANNNNPNVFNSFLPTKWQDGNLTVGVDALGNAVTYKQALETAKNNNTSYDVVYSGLLSQSKDSQIEARTDFLNSALTNAGVDVNNAEVKENIQNIVNNKNLQGNELLNTAVNNYVSDNKDIVYLQGAVKTIDNTLMVADNSGKLQPVMPEINDKGNVEYNIINSDGTLLRVNEDGSAYIPSLVEQVEDALQDAPKEVIDAVVNYVNANAGVTMSEISNNVPEILSNSGLMTEQSFTEAISNLLKDYATKTDIETAIAGIKFPVGLDKTDVTDVLTKYMEDHPSLSIKDVGDKITEILAGAGLVTTEGVNTSIANALKGYATTSDIETLGVDLIAKIDINEKANLTRDEATQKAVDDLAKELGVSKEELLKKLGTTETNLNNTVNTLKTTLTSKITATEKTLLAKIAENEKAGLTRDEATQKAVDDLALDLGTTRQDLLDQLGTTEKSLESKIRLSQMALSGQIARTESNLIKKIADNEKANLTRDQATQKAVDEIAEELGTTREDILAQLGATEATLKTTMDSKIRLAQMALEGKIARTESNLLKKIQANEAAGMARDEATQKAISDLSAELGTTKEDLLADLNTTEANLNKTIADLAKNVTNVEQSLLKKVAENETAGMKRDEATQKAVSELAAELGTTEETLLARIGESETTISGKIDTLAETLAGVEKSLLDKIAVNEAANIDRDEAIQLAVDEVASELGIAREDLLKQLNATEENLNEVVNEKFETLQADINEKYEALTDEQKALADDLRQQGINLEAAIETASKTIQQDVQDKYDALTAEQKALADELAKQGVDLNDAIDQAVASIQTDVQAKYEALTVEQKALADQLTQQGVDLNDAIDQAVTSLQSDIQAKYDALTAEQKALADALAEQGVTLEAAIATAQSQTQQQILDLGAEFNTRVDELVAEGRTYQEATQQAFSEINQQNQQLKETLGTQQRQVTQQDIDQLNLMLQGEKDLDLRYDVTGDQQITQEDLDFLQQVVNNEQSFKPTIDSLWGPTGLYKEIAQAEANREADVKAQIAREQAAAKEAERQGVLSKIGQLSKSSGQTIQSVQDQLPTAFRQAQTVYTPVYAGPAKYLDLGSPLDFSFFDLSPEKQPNARTSSQNKMASGGWVDDFLHEDVSVEELLELLR